MADLPILLTPAALEFAASYVVAIMAGGMVTLIVIGFALARN